MLVVTPSIQIPPAEFEFTFARSSGPGGQNVNKVNSKAVLRWNVRRSPSISPGVRQRFVERYGSRLTTEGDFVLTGERYRDQRRNVDDCLEKLRTMLLEVAHPPKTRKKSRPTRASKERRLENKRRDSDKKKNRGRFDV